MIENVSLHANKLKMNRFSYIFMFLFMTISTSSMAQGFHFGIRAGLNYANFQGPAEEGVQESFDFNNGFHFGIVGMYSFNDYFSLGAEILYNQLGTKYKYEGESYYIYNLSDVEYLKEDISLNLDVSNSYVNIPLLIHFKPIKKLELIAGGYIGFLVSPIAGGRLGFGSKFYQSLEYKYYSDTAGSVPYGSTTINVGLIRNEDGETWDKTTTIYKTVGAYYQYNSEQFNEDSGYYYNWFDVGLTGGIQYFFNSSLYGGIRAEYGFLDITNDRLDRSLKVLNEDGSFILKDDVDTNINFSLSLGFRF